MAGKLVEDLSTMEKLIDAESYQVWKFKLIVILKANDIYKLVTEETLEAQRTAEWKKKDANAQKALIITMDAKPLMHVIHCETAYDMWKKLESIYERSTSQQKYNLLQEFFGYTYDKADIATHISELENLAYRLKMLNEKISDEMLMSKILAILPEEYKYFLSAWESSPTTEKTLENLTARLIAEETRGTEKETPVAFKATERKCFKCDRPGHLAKDCKSKFSSASAKKCFTCNKQGHLAKDCFKKINKNREACKICKKTNHVEKDCFFRKKNEDKSQEKVSFLACKERRTTSG